MSIMIRTTRVFTAHLIVCLFINFIIIAALKKNYENNHQIMESDQLSNRPVYTFVKTDRHANIKWGVRHYVPRKWRQINHRN